jgi:folate-binding protein YgfZ
VLRAKAVLDNSELFGLGLSGPNAPDFLADYLGQAAPSRVDAVVSNDDRTLSVIRVPGSLPRFELYGSADALQACAEKLRPQTRAVAHEAWTLLDIQAGLPSVYDATADAFVPQMANFDLLGGINFRKGCYVGQEIVARMHYLGRLKRRMFRLWLADEHPPAAGTDLYAPTLRGEQSVGQIVSAVAVDAGCEALAVLTLDCAEAVLHLANQPDNTVELRDLPYSLTPSEPQKN